MLERYATRFDTVEINSSFYRPHRRSTYQKWASLTPDGFRFSVKVPKAITHTAKLRDCAGTLTDFLDGVGGLGDKLGSLLVQLPPNLNFEPDVTADFFGTLRQQTPVAAVCEPRHASWFTPEADALLRHYRIGRVAADPVKVPAAAVPGGDPQTMYYRWHGSPRMYSSSYSDEALARLAQEVQSHTGETWVIFDNTASGAGVDNALTLLDRLSAP